MKEVHIRPFILHNMLIAFIAHLIILLVWIFVKIWDRLMAVRKSFMFVFLNIMEYTALIVGYILVLMQIAAFSSLNVRK